MAYDVDKALVTKVLEESEIGALVKNKVTPDYLIDDDTRSIFEWVLDQYEEHGKVPSLGLVQEQFPDFEAENTEDSLEMVLDTLRDRRLYAELQKEMKTIASEARDDPAMGLKALQKAASALSNQFAVGNLEDVTQSAALVLRQYKLLEVNRGLLGLPWPWERLNQSTRGVRKGSFSTIYGPPGVYKTWLLIVVGDFAHQEVGAKPIFFTYEMPLEDVRFRWACWRARVDYERVQTGDLTKKEKARLERTLKSLKGEEPFVIAELETSGEGSLIEIQSKTKDHGCNLILLDGLAFGAGDLEWVPWDKFLRGVKTMARKTRIPIVATHHTNLTRKTVKATDSDATDVAYGDSLLRHTDNLIRLWQTKQMEEVEEIGLVTKKVREGKKCTFYIKARPAVTFDFAYDPEATDQHGHNIWSEGGVDRDLSNVEKYNG